MTEKTILVTGGSGFIGTMICKLLADAGHNVVNLDRVKKTIPNVTQYPFDIDNHQVKGLLKVIKPDTIIHLAADHEVGRSVLQPGVFYHNNVANSITLLNCAIETGVKNFIFSSSSSVYGDILSFPTDELTPKAPLSPYGKTKSWIEDALPDYETAYGLKFVSLRYFNAAGADPELTHGYTQEPASHLVPILCKKALANETVVINGNDYDTPDGTAVRDYTHVFDIATAHLAAINYLDDGGKSTTFNIGAGEPKSILEVIKTFEELGINIPYEFGPKRAGDPAITFADITKAKQLLGWSPIYKISDIVQHAWAWETKRTK